MPWTDRYGPDDELDVAGAVGAVCLVVAVVAVVVAVVRALRRPITLRAPVQSSGPTGTPH